ncbi:MAG TPA: hypothetical protein GXZ78_03795 [Eubacteriaceae bacterium]|nr:hypothetical protein [Eubacteriaceae bacterium]
MNRINDYIIALTHLYGLVDKDKVVEIFNMQNEEKINIERLKQSIDFEELKENYVEFMDDYFIHDTILEFDDFDNLLSAKADKPFYIPNQKELLKYKDDNYFEINKEYNDLFKYINKNLLDGDEWQARMIVDDIQGYCQIGAKPSEIFNIFNHREISFNDEKQVNDVLQLVMNLANNTRIWENNGHTPNEIFERYEKHKLKPLPNKRFEINRKIGRNDPCPCGSGKKYKRCCLGKDDN